MSFIEKTPGKGFNAGYFLVDDENCTRVSVTVKQNHAAVVTREDGSKYVPAGAIIPANDATAKGILYEDTDVTTGDMPGSIVTRGAVYTDRLPAAPSADTTEGGATTPGAASVLTAAGITFVATSPAITRPY